MKVLDADDFLKGIDQTLGQLQSLNEQIKQVHKGIDGLVSLEEALKGKAGQSIRDYYQECHLPFLTFFENFITKYTETLNHTKRALQTLEPSRNGFIRQSFLENELEQGLQKADQITGELTDEANNIMQSVSDIVALPRLRNDEFTQQIWQTRKEKRDTVEKLNNFDRQQEKVLKVVWDDVQTMTQYVQKISSLVKNGDISLANFQTEQLKDVESYMTKMGAEAKEEEAFNPYTLVNDIGKYVITGQSIAGAALVWGKQIQFVRKKDDKTRTKAVIHTAQWMKGKGDKEFFKKLASRMDQSIRNPGIIMKTFKGIDGAIDKYAHIQVLGLSKSTGFENWLKNVVVGVDKGRSGIKISKIPGMIARRVYPIDAAFNIYEEGWKLKGELKKGDFDSKDVAAAASNVVIKTGVTAVGAIAGGAVGALFGPAGAAAGAFIGGGAGAWAGDALAGFTENVIRKGAKTAFKEAGENISNNAKKGFNWVKGVFK